MSKEKSVELPLHRSPHYISWLEADWSKPLTEEDELMIEVLWDPESEKGMLAFEKLKALRENEHD